MHSNNSEKEEEVQRDPEQNSIEKEDPNNLMNPQPQEEDPKEEKNEIIKNIVKRLACDYREVITNS